MHETLKIVIFLVAPAIYLAPAIEAKARNRVDAPTIFLINLVLGWTVIGWANAGRRTKWSRSAYAPASWGFLLQVIRAEAQRIRQKVEECTRLRTDHATGRENGPKLDRRQVPVVEHRANLSVFQFR